MSIRRTIVCNIEGCVTTFTENQPGAGFPEWGVLQGRINELGETEFHLCPRHCADVFGYAATLKED